MMEPCYVSLPRWSSSSSSSREIHSPIPPKAWWCTVPRFREANSNRKKLCSFVVPSIFPVMLMYQHAVLAALTHGVITGVTWRSIDPLRQARPQPGPHKQCRRLESELTAWMFKPWTIGPPETPGLKLVVVVNPLIPIFPQQGLV